MNKERMYNVILAAGDHGKVDHGRRVQSGDLSGRQGLDQARDQAGGRGAVRRQGEGGQHPQSEGKVEAFPRSPGQAQRRQRKRSSPSKRAR